MMRINENQINAIDVGRGSKKGWQEHAVTSEISIWTFYVSKEIFWVIKYIILHGKHSFLI